LSPHRERRSAIRPASTRQHVLVTDLPHNRRSAPAYASRHVLNSLSDHRNRGQDSADRTARTARDWPPARPVAICARRPFPHGGGVTASTALCRDLLHWDAHWRM